MQTFLSHSLTLSTDGLPAAMIHKQTMNNNNNNNNEDYEDYEEPGQHNRTTD